MGDRYEGLAERAERGELSVKPGSARYGVEAVVAARADLLAASGAGSVEEFTRMALGSSADEER